MCPSIYAIIEPHAVLKLLHALPDRLIITLLTTLSTNISIRLPHPVKASCIVADAQFVLVVAAILTCLCEIRPGIRGA